MFRVNWMNRRNLQCSSHFPNIGLCSRRDGWTNNEQQSQQNILLMHTCCLCLKIAVMSLLQETEDDVVVCQISDTLLIRITPPGTVHAENSERHFPSAELRLLSFHIATQKVKKTTILGCNITNLFIRLRINPDSSNHPAVNVGPCSKSWQHNF